MIDIPDILHLVGFLASIGSYAFLQYTGHNDATSQQALIGVASAFVGSYLRGTTQGSTK